MSDIHVNSTFHFIDWLLHRCIEADIILVDIEIEEMWVKCEIEFWNIVKEEANAQGHFIRKLHWFPCAVLSVIFLL